MNLKNIFPPKIKNASVLLTFVLISGLLFSSQTSSNYLSNFFADFVGSISTNKTEVCIDESATITFKGENGTAPYTFTYEVNGLEQTVTSIGDTKTLSVNTTTVGDFKYKLTKVEDSSVSSLVVTPNKEVTIKVIATPIPNFTITNNNACSGETVQFINTSTGDDLTYEWEFGDGNISTLENPSNIYNNLFGCDKTDFTVKLTVTNKNNCSSTFNNVVTILHKPAFEIKDVDSPFDHFNYCSNSPTDDFNINVGLKSFDTCLSTYDIDWGDGNIENNISFPINHLYAKLGGYTMLITGTSTNGCKTVLETTVRKGSDPSGGFPSPGGIDNLCIPVNIEFGISGWHGNSNNTTYVVDFGDGSPIETYTQTELDEYSTLNPTSDKFPTPHEYTISSCDTDTGKFFPRVTITNPCDEKSFGPDDGISILKKPELDFSWDENTCLDTPITFYNNSISGNGKDCSISGEYTWDFGDGTPTVTTEDITPTPHTYTSPGKYTVTLSAFSYCNQTDSVKVEKEICIETKTTADFSVDNNEGCIPLAVTATNTIDKTDICSEPTYNWNVNYDPNNCSSSSSFSFTNGTTSTSENPQFIFNNPGKYTITQIVTNLCGTETKSQVIDVKKPPTVSINNIADACGSITINPTAIIENCTTDTSALTYKWTFPGGLPTTATTLNPGDIVYSTSGVYEVTLEVTNDCGISNKATESFEVLEIPIITNTNLTQEICSGETTSEIVLTSDKTGTTYSWSAVASSVGISGFTTNGNSNTIPSQTLTNTLNSVETVTYTVTPTLNTCVGDPVDFVITVYPTLIITKQPISSEICLDGTATELEVASSKRNRNSILPMVF